MPNQKFLSRVITKLLEWKFSLENNPSRDIGTPNRILVVRQHNQFGDLLASVSLFRAIKESYPDSHLTVIVSPDNFYAITKNEFIDEYFIFDKSKLVNPEYYVKLKKVLKGNYDLSIVPATVSISFTSCLLGRLSDAKTRIGPKSLNGKTNKYTFLFDRRTTLDWRKCPDAHISDFGLDIVRPFGINTKNFKSSISFDESDQQTAKSFLESMNITQGKVIVGLHIGAGKPPNRWSLDKYIELINSLIAQFDAQCYITGSSADQKEIDYVKAKLKNKISFFINHSIPELAALISITDLFITNDTGVMHVAGATEAKQVSIFGPTNPFNWAPIGQNKYFLRKSDLIDDITVGDVFNLCKLILEKRIGK